MICESDNPDNFCIPREKVFCIGLNKTGTTSIEAALQGLGYRMGHQPHGEMLLKSWLKRDFKPIIEFAKTADAFQDIPFSLPYTFVILDAYFLGAKFILTVRDSARQWFESVARSSADLIEAPHLPSIQELKSHPYRYPGFLYDSQCGVILGTSEDPFDLNAHIAFYESHIYVVRSYFRNSDRLLVLNVADPGSYLKMCQFLGKEPVMSRFPHLNQSATDLSSLGLTLEPNASGELLAEH